jgi:hypothetical protein
MKLINRRGYLQTKYSILCLKARGIAAAWVGQLTLAAANALTMMRRCQRRLSRVMSQS